MREQGYAVNGQELFLGDMTIGAPVMMQQLLASPRFGSPDTASLFGLGLGLSGFETGVAVMPQVRGGATDSEDNPAGRIRGTKRLLTTAALIMSAFLITSSIVTTLLIPQEAFQPGGPANGRALAYLAHEYLGNVFGSVYDISTICILWFAGASALAGLLNLVPRYLPRYGMAP